MKECSNNIKRYSNNIKEYSNNIKGYSNVQLLTLYASRFAPWTQQIYFTIHCLRGCKQWPTLCQCQARIKEEASPKTHSNIFLWIRNHILYPFLASIWKPLSRFTVESLKGHFTSGVFQSFRPFPVKNLYKTFINSKDSKYTNQLLGNLF